MEDLTLIIDPKYWPDPASMLDVIADIIQNKMSGWCWLRMEETEEGLIRYIVSHSKLKDSRKVFIKPNQTAEDMLEIIKRNLKFIQKQCEFANYIIKT